MNRSEQDKKEQSGCFRLTIAAGEEGIMAWEDRHRKAKLGREAVPQQMWYGRPLSCTCRRQVVSSLLRAL